MYRVSSTHLGVDGRRVQASGETLDRGKLTAEQLAQLLAAFVEIDAADNEQFDPHLVIAGPAARVTVRTNQGRLHVYDVRDHYAPAHEMTIPALLERLDRAPAAPAAATDAADHRAAPRAPHRSIAFAMLVVGLALNGYILYSVFYVESVNKKVEVKLLADAGDAKTTAALLAGTYATGGRTGDRVIEVGAAGRIRFYEIGARGPINDFSDTYRLGRHDRTLCLTTQENGVVDLLGENLVYYRDAYARRRPSS